MAPRARFRNSFLWILVLLLLGCNKTGKQTPERTFVNSATHKITWVKGRLQVNNQPFSGVLYSLYAGTTDTLETAAFLNGQEHGTWKKFYPNGKLQEKRAFTKGLKTGEYVAFWENGGKKLQYFFAAGEYEGTCHEWNKTGLLVQEMNYVQGHESGSQKLFWDNGKIKSNYFILNGRRYGLLGTKNCVNVSDSIFTN